MSEEGRLILCSLFNKDGLAVLDGGFTDEGQRAIRQTHLDFLEAGAQIISTSTYQASPLSLRLAGVDGDSAKRLIIRSVELAEEARQQYVTSHAGRDAARLISLSLGPYGAVLANGSEYTGQYYVPDDPHRRAVTVKDMSDFHFDRLRVVASSEAWKSVDLLAFETIPRLDEALAIRDSLQRLYQDASCERKPAYVSFVFPNGDHLPFVSADKYPTRIEELVRATVGTFDGIGINCTKPDMLLPLVQKFNGAARAKFDSSHLKQKPILFLYPDGGLVWNGQSREWQGSTISSDKTWSTVVLEAAACAIRSSQWSGCFVGGCCKATVDDVKELAHSLSKHVR